MGIIHLTDDGRGCFTFTLENAGRRNAMNDGMIASLIEGLSRLRDDESCRVVVFRGAKGDFCAGRDIGNLDSFRARSALEIRKEYQRLSKLNELIYYFPRPTLSVIEGYALGLGTAFASWSDIAIASDDAQFGYPEVKVGLPPTQTTLSLIRSVPRKFAVELVLTGRRVQADEAARIGLITRAVAHADLGSEADKIVDSLIAASPDAVAMCKELIHVTEDVDYRAGVVHAQDLISIAVTGRDAEEGLDAFVKRRKPAWPSNIEVGVGRK